MAAAKGSMNIEFLGQRDSHSDWQQNSGSQKFYTNSKNVMIIVKMVAMPLVSQEPNKQQK